MKIIFHNNIVNNNNFYDLCEKHFDKLAILFNEDVFNSVPTGCVALHFKNGKIELIEKLVKKKVVSLDISK